MKICVKEIMQGGLDLEEEISSKDLDLDVTQVRSTSSIKIKAHIEKEKDIVTASCTIEVSEKRICSKCLSEFIFLFNKKEDFVYSLSGEHIIELNDDIKDTIILDYPIRQLCSPSCKGLCYCCGKNLNEGPCVCKGEKDMVCQK